LTTTPEHLTWTDADGNAWDLTHGWQDTEGIVWVLYGWEVPVKQANPARPVVHAPDAPSLDTYTLDTLAEAWGPLKPRTDVKAELENPEDAYVCRKATGKDAPVFGC
jgi:hypothetical protein